MFSLTFHRFATATLLALSLSILPLNAEEVRLSSQEEASVQEQYANMIQEPGQVMFTPPEGWQMADPKALPASVKIMVVGKGEREFPPSINLGTEKYSGTLKQYLKTVKAINDSQGTEWKDLGTIKTEAGDASLSQVDAKTQWGNVRTMHVILLRDGTIYIMTAAATKEEFPKYYKDFFNAMRSLRVNKDLYEQVGDTSRRSQLIQSADALKQSFNDQLSKQKNTDPNATKLTIFNSPSFQKSQWEPFKSTLARDYSDMSPEWQKLVLERVQRDLTN